MFSVSNILSGADTSDQLIEKAEGSYVSGDFQSAISTYNDFLKKYPSDPKIPEVFYWRARACLAMDHFGEARESFEKAQSLTGDATLKEDALLGYADCLYYVGEMEGALAEYEKIYQNKNTSHAAYLLYQLGMIWKARGNEVKARAFFQTLLKEYPDSYEAAEILRQDSFKSKGLYYIQVGVFQVRKNVDRLVVKLSEVGYPHRIDEVNQPNGRVYRLRVGPFNRDEDARKALFEIQRIADVKGNVVKE